MGTVTERERMLLRQWAEQHMDGPTAEAFMNSAPPTGWGDVATKLDIASLREDIERSREATQAQIEALQTVLTAMFTAQLATAIGGVQSEFSKEFNEVHKQIAGVHKEIAGVHQQIGEVRGGQRGQTIALIVTILVAFLGQAAVPHFLPPPAPQIILQSPGQ